MPDPRSALENSRQAILLGEFGALLHMFGKASREFLTANSAEGCAGDTHQDEKHFESLPTILKGPDLSDRFTFGSEKLAGDFTDFFRKYKGNDPDSHLLKLFNTCHRMTSADEKGVVRRKQSIYSMRITTPFGRKAQTVPVGSIDAIRSDMARQLAAVLDDYLKRCLKIEDLRERAIGILKPGLSQTLGETREPANDVTLWAQSFGVASLYKSTLASVALGKDPCPERNNAEYQNVRWRLLGIGWNGAAFVQRGRKAADILERQSILARIRRKLQSQLESDTPIGNLFYADLNGLFFTFPGIDKDPSYEVLKGIGPSLIDLIREESDNEIWPFLTLSRPRRTLTAIAQQISTRDRLATAPCTAATLVVEDDGSDVLLAPGPGLKSASRHEVCPICRVRDKAATAETCVVCRDRRSGRQAAWLRDSGGETIWVNEIADTGNRLALLTLRMDLAPWLSGEQLSTVLSQTLQDWWDAPRMRKLRSDQGKSSALHTPSDPCQEFAVRCLRYVLDSGADAALTAEVLGTFFGREVPVSNKNFETHLENIRQRVEDLAGDKLSVEDLARFLFTHNASPGRLMRIWEAADTFVGSLITSIQKGFASRPRRISFRVANSIDGVDARRTYRLTIPELRGNPLVILAKSKQDFLTADNLSKFGSPDDVCRALITNGVQEWRDEETGDLVGGSTPIIDVSLESEYLPFTVTLVQNSSYAE